MLAWILRNTWTTEHRSNSTSKKKRSKKNSDNNKRGEARGSCNNVPLKKEAKVEAVLQMVVVCAAVKYIIVIIKSESSISSVLVKQVSSPGQVIQCDTSLPLLVNRHTAFHLFLSLNLTLHMGSHMCIFPYQYSTWKKIDLSCLYQPAFGCSSDRTVQLSDGLSFLTVDRWVENICGGEVSSWGNAREIRLTSKFDTDQWTRILSIPHAHTHTHTHTDM